MDASDETTGSAAHSPLPRLRSITGVARALIGTVGVDDAVQILIAQFGFDVALQSLAGIDDGDAQAGRAMWLAVTALDTPR